MPGCELGHHGEDVSFDSILKKYGLTHPALRLLAEIVRLRTRTRATRIRPVKAFAGVAHGFSALGLSDPDILDREFIVYDALYAECRRRAEAGG